MQKTIKRIALLLVLAIAVTCAAVFTTACGGETEKGYAVQVVCDDSDVDFTQLSAQWCKANAQGETEGNCYGRPTTLDANGKATPQNMNGTPLDLTEIQKTEATYGFHVQLNGLEELGYTYAQGQNLHVTKAETLTIKIVKIA